MSFRILLSFTSVFIINAIKSQTCGSIYQEFSFNAKSEIWNAAISQDKMVYTVGGLNYANNESGALIFKTDSIGKILWAKSIRGRRLQLFRRVIALRDSGALAVGATSSFPITNSFSALITRWDKNGNLIWSRVFSTNSQFGDWGLGVEELSSGEILFLANNNSNGFYASALVIKIKSNGDLIWGKRFKYFEGTNFRTSLEEEDGYLVAGEYLYDFNKSYRTVIVKVDKQTGEMKWLRSYANNGNNISSGPLVKTENGSLALRYKSKIFN